MRGLIHHLPRFSKIDVSAIGSDHDRTRFYPCKTLRQIP